MYILSMNMKWLKIDNLLINSLRQCLPLPCHVWWQVHLLPRESKLKDERSPTYLVNNWCKYHKYQFSISNIGRNIIGTWNQVNLLERRILWYELFWIVSNESLDAFLLQFEHNNFCDNFSALSTGLQQMWLLNKPNILGFPLLSLVFD